MLLGDFSVSPVQFAASPKKILICVLGSFRMLVCGSPLAGIGEKAEMLLSTLALERNHCASRNVLLERLWPMKDSPQAGALLRNVVFRLRALTDTALAGAMPIVREGTIYRLDLNADVGVDILDFESHISKGKHYSRTGHIQLATSSFRNAVNLYQGDLLDLIGMDVETERERLRSQYIHALEQLASYSLLQGDADNCLEYAFRMLICNSFNEEAYRLIMRAYLGKRQRGEAIRQYLLCRDVLKREFDLMPEPETTALYTQIINA